MLIFDDTTFGIQECKLDLSGLYPTINERLAFDTRFNDFIKSDSANQQIFTLQGDTLKYYSEVFISDRVDNRPPLLLLLGNPASHSVAAGMCFAFEKSGREHRFWRILEETGILTFLKQPSISTDPVEMNESKRNALLELKYLSPFRIGIAVFYSLPSSASDRRWSGVSGVKKLFRAKAFDRISLQEEKRIGILISKFMGPTGGIISFQKDAYNRVRSENTPAYSLDLAMRGLLRGEHKSGQQLFLAGSPPTRRMQTTRGKSALLQCKIWLSQQLKIQPCSPCMPHQEQLN